MQHTSIKDINLLELKENWEKLKALLKEQFDEEPDLQTIVFLIGVQELGKGRNKYSKREKMELMHIATCKLLSQYGYYELEGLDQDGWPHWKPKEPIPNLTLQQQDRLLKQAAIDYFVEMGLLSEN